LRTMEDEYNNSNLLKEREFVWNDSSI
jgi:hypothetical protein